MPKRKEDEAQDQGTAGEPAQEPAKPAKGRRKAARKSQVPADVRRQVRSTASSQGSEIRQLIDAIQGTRREEPPQVGIRNVGGSTVGVPQFENELSFSLHPWNPNDPNSMAVISYRRWQNLRKSKLYGLGLIERYDDIVDDAAVRAPADKPHECHPDHARNKVVDPHAFIQNQDETEMRGAILRMTSENSLQRLQAAVDEKFAELERKYREEGDPKPGKRAEQEMPIRYQVAERILTMRLEQIRPAWDSTAPIGKTRSE